MKTNDIKAIILNKYDAALLTECGQRGDQAPQNPYAGPFPRLVILTGNYSDDGVLFPAQSVVLYGDPVRKLYEALKGYFEDDHPKFSPEQITELRNQAAIDQQQ